MIRVLIVAFFLVITVINTNAQGFLRTEGNEIVDKDGNNFIIRGMGLGGWMLQEGYMLQTSGFANAQHQIRSEIEALIGPEKTEVFYQAWRANHMTKADVDSLKLWGFNAVRLPLHYNLFTLPIQDEPVPGQNTWIDTGFELTDQLLDWCEANQMYVILDLHAAPGGQGYEEAISDYDPTKPSLWESELNREKTVALWKRIAQRYVDEPWIGGYDLINEPNWNMDQNQALRELYEQITAAIRTVDQNHIIFIEGNWFANDFTGLTPPWDDNMVYSPHKYWSVNDLASISWVLGIRNQYNVPIWFGESGENSNVWFRDAIRLFEDNNIGWAWWPLKKVESIAGPLSWQKSDSYQKLLDYWSGNGPQPSAEEAEMGIMSLAEGMKIENLDFQKDVINAMFHQVSNDETTPFRKHQIPGIIHATDFDMGRNGQAYFDQDVANYQVTTGSYTAWNNGWTYRNDGVDIERSLDNSLTNGYNVGWTDEDEWMQYSAEVMESGVYEIIVRMASATDQGRFHFNIGDVPLSPPVQVPNSGDWQEWISVSISDIVLEDGIQKIRFFTDQGSFNIGGMQFIRKSASTDILTTLIQSETNGSRFITLTLNKPIDGNSVFEGFEINRNEEIIDITDIELVSERTIQFTLNQELSATDIVLLSYSGETVVAFDGTILQSIQDELVTNNLASITSIPGRVEAEDYSFAFGMQLESTTDEGGGQNIGYLDVGDYAEYLINVPEPGDYHVDYRTAALSETGAIKLEYINDDEIAIPIHEVSFSPTGDWQNWTTTRARATLPDGLLRLRMTITAPLFNMNWLEFSLATVTQIESDLAGKVKFLVYPNPSNDRFLISVSFQQPQDILLTISDLSGRTIVQKIVPDRQEYRYQVEGLSPGVYLASIQGTYFGRETKRIIVK